MKTKSVFSFMDDLINFHINRWRGTNAAGQQHLNTIEFNKGCRTFTSDLDNVKLYRSHSGVCNRLQSGKEQLGILSLPFQRLLPAEYHGKSFHT